MVRVICADISGMEESSYRCLYEKAVPQRRSKADRYRRQEDAFRCIAADALLRYALGAQAYTVEEGSRGKPHISGRPDFHYNLTHAGNWVAIAFGSREVGVDVEQVRADTDIMALARRFFAPREQTYVLEDIALQRHRFFEVWTGKESYIKYLGTGLATDLTSFQIFDPDPRLRIFRRWISEDTCLSLCTEEEDWELKFLSLPELLAI